MPPERIQQNRDTPDKNPAGQNTDHPKTRKPQGPRRAHAAWALALLLPAPTLGAAAALILFPGAALGRGLYAACKVWILLVPLLFLVLERRPPAVSRMRLRDVATGTWMGVVMAAAVLAAYLLVRRSLVDAEHVRAMARRAGLADPAFYLACGIYWTVVNSLLEEYVWRWFVILCWERFVSSRAAVALSAVCFTVHHAVALSAWFQRPAVCLASTGVLAAGLVWGRLRQRTGNIWAAWISHMFADAAIFGLGGLILFG